MPSLYSQIALNKRHSLLLVLLVLALVIGAVALYSYAVRGDFVLPIAAAVLAIPSSLIGYYGGDKIALASNRAHAVSESQTPELHTIVENLAITAGVPKPNLYLINSPALNAFATGRDPAHASIAVTTGLIERLDRSELEGVLAHELSHVRNYDIRFATLVAVFVGFIVILSDLFTRSMFWSGGRRRGASREDSQTGAIFAIIGVILLIVSPVVAKLIQLAISRQREFLADSSGVLLTRYPDGLASALEKISAGPALNTAGHATAHLFIANPFKARSFANLFATHPPVEERIRRLRNL
ncbi:MAG: zinc metalloprotease HtpX [Candidatus Andersenbacteria bacterium CG10_big_fil_rev_8_21_14_0_10_54_11]|uniref:Protease HtpX homolog n=1 Tax=Candidatus Andersenbacteria bacterium CG10_big_fil_rev_8_21_14_0_10_54_11 TaxID=1974485 RepID=A0A2M6WYA0_9BACT|nr:MAG: zinc metalloprotease HtpX [Candidatus Andersenbacteria bacterium CG10_big_fil_rev_8_21_14_0_10_54_11]